MQLSDGKPEEAVATAEAALAATPTGEKKDERVELMLGQSQLKAGKKAQGDETLTALLKETDDPDIMNDAAYELADAGLELPLAEQTTRAALDKMEQQSRTWTLDENQMTLRQKTRMMEATWDTMGWIYFRNGKLKEAEEYVSAAWRGRQDAEVGSHLAEIAIERGDKNRALRDYELAQATFVNYDMMGVRTEPGTRQKEIMASADRLRKDGAHTSVTDAHDELQKMRTISLGAAAGMSGVAEYKLLVNGGIILRAEQAGTKSVAGGEERLKKVALAGFLPPQSVAQLVFTGVLNCHSDTCELILEP
jgi:hypothetical protein